MIKNTISALLAPYSESLLFWYQQKTAQERYIVVLVGLLILLCIPAYILSYVMETRAEYKESYEAQVALVEDVVNVGESHKRHFPTYANQKRINLMRASSVILQGLNLKPKKLDYISADKLRLHFIAAPYSNIILMLDQMNHQGIKLQSIEMNRHKVSGHIDANIVVTK